MSVLLLVAETTDIWSTTDMSYWVVKFCLEKTIKTVKKEATFLKNSKFDANYCKIITSKNAKFPEYFLKT